MLAQSDPTVVTLKVNIPEKLAPLLEPKRYKGAHGGRGGGKSHTMATMVVLKALQQKSRIVCIREVQNSIKESVKALIEQKIIDLGIAHEFQVLEHEIRCRNGGLIVFKGMQAYNAANIKSLEDFDVAWVEEAQTLSAISWRMLRPTIRKPGSEIWCSWNPLYDNHAVDQFFRGPNKHPDAICIEINWNDNPWFTDELKVEKDLDYASDPEMAEHVWGGGYELVSEGAYYAKLIVQAEKEGRIGHFPYDPRLEVRTAWDIGVDDYTAVWFCQEDGKKIRVVDYFEFSDVGGEQVLGTCMPEIFIPPRDVEEWINYDALQVLQEINRDIPFRYERHYLPHDVKNREWGAGGRSRIQILQSFGLTDIAKGAAMNPADRIAAVRRILPICEFNHTERVAHGLKRLRRYKKKFHDALNTYQGPLHDENSHGADSFGEYAVNSPLSRINVQSEQPTYRPGLEQWSAMSEGAMQATRSVREIVEEKMRRKRSAEL